MFSLSYMTEHKGPVNKIFVKKFPHPFGVFTDVYGVSWHANGQVGNHILAVPYHKVDEYWTSTSGFITPGFHQQSWPPNEIVIVNR